MNELRAADENSKRAMGDAARLAEELRREQEHAGQIEKLRRALEAQVSFSNTTNQDIRTSYIKSAAN